MKEELQQALRALEKNLKDIQAANETVKIIRTQAAEDIKAAGDVINKINQEIDIIDSHFKNWLDTFGTSTKTTFKTFETKAQESVKKITELNDTLKGQMDANLDTMSESNRLLFQKYETAWSKHNQELDRVYLKLEATQQAFEGMKRQIDQVDFPKKLEGIGKSIGDVALSIEEQRDEIKQMNKSQNSKFTILMVMASLIIIFQLISMFIK